MDDVNSALGRSDKAIDSLTHELIKLKESLGKEIAVKHIYSGELHYGLLKTLEPEFLTLENPNSKVDNKIKLKIANIELLEEKEFINWKINNLPSKTYEISAVFPIEANPRIIKNTIKQQDNIVNVKISEVYQGSQIKKEEVSITFSIETFSKKHLKSVEELLKGFGAIIR
jgi:prephenate dehydrogenase